ncbi:MAG: SMP-30/gluconolactonase/LRE family protein [Chlamydiales bacterium]|nr:SMP-30/gluconolactonase/LRE family protein [Chlamydiia bacterium]MCP5507137.1 SMP-30/gluconolactonase/LRE family protein [Chlamydiales bacterium]
MKIVLALIMTPVMLFAEIVNAPPYPTEASPQLPLEVYSDEFAQILGTKPKLVHLAEGFGFTEGPAYVQIADSEEGYLLFTDQINDNILIMRWHGLLPYNEINQLSWSKPEIFRHPSNIADGQTMDLQGRLLTAETTGRRVSITDLNGEVKTLAGFYDGKPLNSPNDLVVKSDGTVWFTDPGYGCLQFPQECYLPNNVYRYDPKTEKLEAVITDLMMPNGIAFSPDEKILYVIDSGAIQAPRTYYEHYPHAIYAWDVTDGKALSNKRLYADISPGFPDGMRLDNKGNIYVGALDGVHVLNPEGKLIGKILMPKETANLSFGGKDNNILFICSSNSVWAIKLNTKGAKPVPTIHPGN